MSRLPSEVSDLFPCRHIDHVKVVRTHERDVAAVWAERRFLFAARYGGETCRGPRRKIIDIEVLIDIGDCRRPPRIELQIARPRDASGLVLRYSRAPAKAASIRAASNRGDERPDTASTFSHSTLPFVRRVCR